MAVGPPSNYCYFHINRPTLNFYRQAIRASTPRFPRSTPPYPNRGDGESAIRPAPSPILVTSVPSSAMPTCPHILCVGAGNIQERLRVGRHIGPLRHFQIWKGGGKKSISRVRAHCLFWSTAMRQTLSRTSLSLFDAYYHLARQISAL